jgi:uncharacterized protein (TIGR02001 family)
MRILTSFTLKSVLSTLLVLSMMFSTGPVSQAQAEDANLIPGSFSGSMGFVTEYRYRGLDQSDDHPAIQGSFDWSHEKGYYLGIWGSNVDFGDTDQGNTEFDIYGGVARQYYGIDIDLGFVYYAYPGANDSLQYDFFEYKVGLGYAWELLSLSGSLNYSPEFFGATGDALYMSYDADVPLRHGFGLALHVGRQWITDSVAYGIGGVDSGRDYVDWSAGLNYSTHGFDLSVTYVDTDLTTSDKATGADDTVIFGVSRSF